MTFRFVAFRDATTTSPITGDPRDDACTLSTATARRLVPRLFPLLLVVVFGCRDSEPAVSRGTAGDVPQSTVPQSTGSQLFSEVAEARSILFRHQAGGPADYFMARSIGSGVALLDCNGDGRLDIYALQNGGPESDARNQLFVQTDSDQFHNASDGSGLDVAGYGMGVAAGDINNDGKTDLVVSEYGRLRLFINRSANTVRFVEALETGLTNPAWGTSLAFLDFDRDGWLDLVVVNYVNDDPSRTCTDAGGRLDFCAPQVFAPVVDRLYRNLGGAGTEDSGRVPFEDVTIASGLAQAPGPGLGVFCADFNGDHWTDILVANDGVANRLWVNQQDGTFVDEAAQRGLAFNALGDTEADMGIAAGDVDADGRFDVFITHRATETHTLWTQPAAGVFVDRTSSSGLLQAAWKGTGFGTALADLDNDGDLDLVFVNGRVLRSAESQGTAPADLKPFWRPYAQRDQIFLNDGQGRFVDGSTENDAFAGEATVSRGLAVGDINNDGRCDLVVSDIGGRLRVYQNRCDSSGHWLLVRAIDPAHHRDAYGAEVTVISDGRSHRRWINPGSSYLSSNDPRAHFGLGSAEAYQALQVIWPDGTKEQFSGGPTNPGGPTNRMVTVRRGEGE